MRGLTERLPEIIEVFQTSDVRELVIEENGTRIRMHRGQCLDGYQPTTSEGDVHVLAEPEALEVVSPLVGTFYRAGHPGMAPLVSEGSRVEPVTVVGIIEALQVLTEVQAGCSGVVASALATDGQPVEYGQILFTVLPGA